MFSNNIKLANTDTGYNLYSNSDWILAFYASHVTNGAHLHFHHHPVFVDDVLGQVNRDKDILFL